MSSPYSLPDGNVQISFSGGRTSAYMLHQIVEANGPLPDRVQVVFANTGREMPETLDFVHECGERWGVKIVWIERDGNGGPGRKFRTVSHNSAARDGEPFEDMILHGTRPYLPNPASRHCTSDLKIRPARDYLRSLGWNHWNAAVGIRADESHRLAKPQKERWQVWRPLVDAGVAKHDVTAFWSRQPFDLRLLNVKGSTPQGNCDGCFLKSEANICGFARDYPERFAWWERMEAIAQQRKGVGPKSAQFREEYTRADLRRQVERQGDMLLGTPGLLCQADAGECFE